jgi:hypothetical protein
VWFKDAGVFDNNNLGDLCSMASSAAAAALTTTDVTCVDFQSLQSKREQEMLLRARQDGGNMSGSVRTITRLRDEVELISSATVHVLFHGGATCVELSYDHSFIDTLFLTGTPSCLLRKGLLQ